MGFIKFIVIMLSLTFFVFPSHTEEKPFLGVAVDDITYQLFSKSQAKRIEKFISKNLKEAFWKAWSYYLANKGSIKDGNIRNALDSLLEKLENGDKKLILRFMFDGSGNDPVPSAAAGYYDMYKKRYTHNYRGNMTLGDFSRERDRDVHGAFISETNKTDEIIIYNGLQDFQWKNISARNEKCELDNVLFRLNWLSKINDLNTLQPEAEQWKESGQKTYSFASAIFHEIVHIALKDANMSRYGDDATIEDIVLKVFPRGTGFNLYEMQYNESLWKKKFQYYGNSDNRKFNPPYELRYSRTPEIGLIVWNGRKYQEKILCDDAEIAYDPVPPWVIPYWKCCDPEPSAGEQTMGRQSSVPESGCPPSPPGSTPLGMPKFHWPGNDHGDDNFSYAVPGNIQIYNLAPDCIIYENGYYEYAKKLLGGHLFDGQNTADEMPLVIPSLGLMGA